MKQLSMFEEVGVFHHRFGLPTHHPKREAALTSREVFEYRLRFLREELAELERAYEAGDLVEVADALADLAWVTLGTAHYFGLPFEDVWWHVARANMQKVLADPTDDDHKRGAAERIRKPEGWRSPRTAIELVINEHNRGVHLFEREP